MTVFLSAADGHLLLCQKDHVLGTYLHGFFDQDAVRKCFVEMLYRRKGIDPEGREDVNYEAFKEGEFRKLSAALRQALDMPAIYRILDGRDR